MKKYIFTFVKRDPAHIERIKKFCKIDITQFKVLEMTH